MFITAIFLEKFHPYSCNVTTPKYSQAFSKAIKKKLPMATGLALTICMGATHAAEYKLAIQPILPPDEAKVQYKPLSDYLSTATGDTITLSTFSSFKSYFANMKRKKGFDMVLDAAHFTDYRANKMNYSVIAKLPDTVSFSLVTGPDLMVFDADELVPYKIATMISPAIGGLRLKELYPDQDNTPTIVRAFNTDDAVKQVQDGRADAAMIPTPLVGKYENLNTVLTTDPIPHMAFSVSPDVPQSVADKIRKALIEATHTEEGRKILSALGIFNFVTASNEDYEGFGNILQITKRNKPALTNLRK